MIELRVTDEALDLGPRFSIQIEMASPLFADVIGYSSHSLKFRLPMTERNRRIFDHADSVLIYQGIEAYDVTVYLFGERWRPGLLNLEEFGLESISVSLDLGEARFSRLLREKSLRDYTLGGVRTITTAGGNAWDLNNPTVNSPLIDHATATVTGNVDSHDYVFFPVRNETMYDGFYLYLAAVDDYDPQNYVNWWRPDQNGFWDELRQWAYNATVSGGLNQGPYPLTGIHPLIPFPYVLYLLRQLCAENGYQLNESDAFLSDAEIRSLALLNPVTLDKLAETYFTFTTPGYVGMNFHAEEIDLRKHVPTTNSRDFWVQLQRMFGQATLVDNTEVRLINKQDHTNANNQIDWRSKTVDYGHTYRAPSAKLGTEASTGDALDSQVNSFDELEVAGTVASVSALPVSGIDIETIYYVEDENAFYRYELEQGSDPQVYVWQFLAYRSDKVEIGDGREDRQSTIGITQMKRGKWLTDSIGFGSLDWDTPVVDMKLISPPYQCTPYEFGPKLAFYRGLKTSPQSYQYPYGSSVKGPADNYSLHWHGPGNLYDSWHKPWYDFLAQGREMNLVLDLSLHDVLELDWTAKPRIRVADGEAVVLLKTLTIKISEQGLDLVEAEAIRI